MGTDRRVILFSGGLDSFMTWWALKDENPVCVYFGLNHKYQNKELQAIEKLEARVPKLKVTRDFNLDLSDYEEEDSYIPLRNLFLIQLASFYGDEVYITVQAGEQTIPDRKPANLTKAGKLIELIGGKDYFKVIPYFTNLTKTEMVKKYIEFHQGNPNFLKLTSSCYNGSNCGDCPACFRRWVALSLNSIDDYYMVPPWKTQTARNYVERAINRVYCKKRNEEILRAVTRKVYYKTWGF